MWIHFQKCELEGKPGSYFVNNVAPLARKALVRNRQTKEVSLQFAVVQPLSSSVLLTIDASNITLLHKG